MTQNLTLARQASTKIKANAVLEDFGHEHMAAVDRDREQLKLRCDPGSWGAYLVTHERHDPAFCLTLVLHLPLQCFM